MKTLAQMMREKYPGSYDDLSDQELEAKIDEKYPGAYSDVPRTEATPDYGIGGIQAEPWQSRPIPMYAVPPPVLPIAMAAKGMGAEMPSPAEVVAMAPDVAGMVGGLIGMASGPWGAMGLSGLAGSAAKAGQSLARQAMFEKQPVPEPTEVAKEIALEGVKQGALEAGGQLAGGLASRALAPGAHAVSGPTSEAFGRLEKRAAEEGLGWAAPPATSISRSPVVAGVEGLASKIPGGGKIAGRYESTARGLTAIADQAIKRSEKLADPSARGLAIVEGFQASKAAFQAEKARLYGQVNLRDIPVNAEGTLKVLDTLLDSEQAAQNVVGKSDAVLFRTIRDNLANNKPSAFELDKAVEALDSMATPSMNQITTGNPARLRKIAASLKSDLMTSLEKENPEMAARLKAADAAYSKGISDLESVAGQRFRKLADEGAYDQIAKVVVNPQTSVDVLPRVMKTVGEKGTEAMRVSVIADLLAKAQRPAGEGGERLLTPKALQNAMRQFGEDRLAVILTPDQLERMNDIATGMASLEKGTKVISGSQTAYLQNLTKMVGKGGVALTGAAVGGAGVATIGLAPTLGAIIGTTQAAKFIASNVGQRWLTTGYPLSMLPRAAISAAPHGVSGAVSWADEQDRIKREGLFR